MLISAVMWQSCDRQLPRWRQRPVQLLISVATIRSF